MFSWFSELHLKMLTFLHCNESPAAKLRDVQLWKISRISTDFLCAWCLPSCFFSSAFVIGPLVLALVRTMGKPGAKAKPSAVVKAAAKKVAKGSCCCDSWTTVSPEVFKPWGDGSCVPSSFCWQEGHQQLPGPNEKGNFRQLLLWMLWLDVLPCSTMFHNKKMDDIQSTSPTKVVRQHVHSLYLIEQLSGQATGKLQAEIAECKVPGFKIRKKLCEKPTSCPTSLQESFGIFHTLF